MSPSSQQIQSNLSAILPVAEACHILGKDTVARVLKSFVQFRSPQRQASNDSVSIFLKALFFDPGENDVPQNIMNNWNQLTRRSAGLEKEQFLKFMIPSAAAPYNAPGGHSGLYDCWFYALSDAGSKSGSNANAPNPVVLLPDILIVVAICREYKTIQALIRSDSPTESLDSRADYASMMLSVLAFRLYDSFQKKGVVVRDTLHRFLSDVHGDDCYKATAIRKILDIMYEAPGNSEKSGSSFLPTLNASQFANGVAKTSRNRHHILLDWIATLGDNMIPIIPLSQSINTYLDALSASNRSLESLCETFSLANLYEIKRRFHSLVETNRVVQGDIIRETQDDDEKKPFRKPRHVISQDVFVNYITKPNDEMGHGGHLPSSLAQRIFQAGSCPSVDDDSSSKFWALFDVLQFGCDAVRQPGDKVRGDITAELPLMRFLFKTFASSNNVNRALTRKKIGEMILLLIEHQFYRLEADRPTLEDDKNERFYPIQKKDIVEESLVHVSIAMMLAISPPNSSKEEWISVSTLVDSCLDSVGVEGDELDFESFCKWHYCKDPSGLPFSQRRFGPLLMELKLIASIFFGIPPTKASLEEALVLEVQRRHKSRYPQTETARRGPRGTIWYILEDKWYKRWVSHVHRVMGNDNDIQDGRGVVGSSARNLGKINNTLLLAEDGSLALKPDIRWKHDYEIIPPMVWSALHAWYDGGPPIYRTVAKYVPSHGPPSVHSRSPRIRTDFEIELYPLFVTVFMCDVSSKGEARPFQQYAPVSRVSPVGVVLVQLCKGLDVDPKLGRLWMMETGTDDLSGLINLDGPEDWLLNLELNIIEQRMRRSGNFDASPSTKIRLLLEIKDTKTGKWPRGLDGKSGIFADRKRLGELSRTPGEPDIGNGIVGLYNMGNTCYLNSSIQCLSHTPIFRNYFTSRIYLKDLNTTNPLGHKGQLAQATAILFNELWKKYNQTAQHSSQKQITAPGSYAPVSAQAITPKSFKEALGKFNEHFAGNEQHDAQELLAFILGGLSEDLNRIVEKPYIEAPDSDGRPDRELADIWWSNHLKREMSIIVALFTGQYKSLLTCRSCKYESARFEPFSFLQLPMPEDDQISVSLVYYTIGNEPIMKYSVRVRHDGTLSDVLSALARVLYVDQKGGPQLMGEKKPNDTFGSNDDEKGVANDDDIDDELEEYIQDKVQNMAIVDMREGYILKIAPNTLALTEVQNKDNGELSVLHVYELDPLPDDTEDEEGDTEQDETAVSDDEVDDNDDDGSTANSEEEIISRKLHAVSVKEGDKETQGEDDEKENGSGPRYSFLALAQRKVEVSQRDVMHPFSHQVFGTPLLLRVNDLDQYTGKELYNLIAERLRPLVPRSALRYLLGAEASGSSEREGDVLTNFTRQRRQRTLSDMEIVAAGPVPRYGFRLRITTRDGRRCSLCAWYQCCIGCAIPDDDYPTIVTCGDSISIDWHFAVDVATNGFGTRLNQLEQTMSQSPFRAKVPATIVITNHPSSNDDARKKGLYGGTVTLEDCLDAFAKEEKIPEAYCSRCKDFRVQTKRMSLWRLPPVVIIQLKRFQFTQHTRRKLRDLVVFPLEGLDLSRILAPDLSKPSEVKTDVPPEAPPPLAKTQPEVISHEYFDPLDPLYSNSSYIDEQSFHQDSILPTPERDDDPMSKSSYRGRSDGAMLYDLYAVIHHQGALSGGHYVASLKSEIDGQWRLFNDAQIFDIHSREVVDSSAYILFYIRRDVKDASLEDFWDIRARSGQGMTEEEVESIMNGRSERCTIS